MFVGGSHAYFLLVTKKVTTMSIATLLFVHTMIYIVIATHERSVVVRVTVRGTFVIYNYYVLHINWYYASCNWLARDEIKHTTRRIYWSFKWRLLQFSRSINDGNNTNTHRNGIYDNNTLYIIKQTQLPIMILTLVILILAVLFILPIIVTLIAFTLVATIALV